jgi:phage shock protein C
MSPNRYHYSSILPEGLVRDIELGKIAGVCAGLGGYFGVRTKWVRVAFILAAIFFFFPTTLIIYGVLALLMPRAPAGFSYDNSFEQRPSNGQSGQPIPPVYTNLHEHFSTLDRRLANMEAWVTSEDYRLRQQFKNL